MFEFPTPTRSPNGYVQRTWPLKILIINPEYPSLPSNRIVLFIDQKSRVNGHAEIFFTASSPTSSFQSHNQRSYNSDLGNRKAVFSRPLQLVDQMDHYHH
jgi:hypothetical protein